MNNNKQHWDHQNNERKKRNNKMPLDVLQKRKYLLFEKEKKTQRKLLHSTPLVTIINCWFKHINENIRPFSVMTKWFDFLILWVSDWVSEWASVHVNMQIKCVFNFDDRNDFKSVTEIRNLSFCIEFCFLNFIFRLNWLKNWLFHC